MRVTVLVLLGVSMVLAAPALGQSAGLYEVSFADRVDEDGDGYYSDFDIEIRADTQCYGCYDEDIFGGDPEMEPFFRVIVNDVDLLDTDIVPRDGDLEWTVRVPQSELEQFERQILTVGVVLFDDDPVEDDIVDRWEETIRYEPSWEDTPTTTPEPRVDAQIVEFDPSNGTYEPGDVVRANVTVENTGEADHTFFVGYGVVGPNGTVYDNDGTTGTTVTLTPDETKTVTVAWVVEPDVPPGTYAVGTAVWAESDRDALETRLDEGTDDATFAVASDETTTTEGNDDAADITGTVIENVTINATTSV